MQQTVYLKINKNIKVNKRQIYISDIAFVLCSDKQLAAKIKNIKLLSIPDVKKTRICVSVMRVIDLISKENPQVDVNNIGESDFVVDYIKPKPKKKWLSALIVFCICVITFVGTAYGIMAYNNDVGTIEIFEKVYELMGASELSDLNVIEVAYAIGLFLGIVIFYDHFAGHKFSKDPTPVEVEMDKYSDEISDALIDDSYNNGRIQVSGGSVRYHEK